MVVEWIIACDQPFDEVERPEFIALMNFMHHAGGVLKIPSHKGIKRRVIKMGEEVIDGIHGMFKVCSHSNFTLQTIK
jgi:hypothetical protein